jgi:UV DNA damage endonuclease
VKRRLAIENCEKCYSVRDCLHIAQATKIPVILDSHHYECYKDLHPNELIEDMDEIVETWDKSNRRPVFHISEQAPSKRIGAHSDFIENIPSYMLELPEKYQRDLFIEVEAKMKEQAIMKLKNKYRL